MDLFYQNVIFYSMPIYRLPEFVAGVFAGILATRCHVPAPSGRTVLCWCLGALGYLLTFSKALPLGAMALVMTPCLVKNFTYFVRERNGFWPKLLSHPVGVFLGEASYVLYLVQIVTIGWYKNPAHRELIGVFGGMIGCFIITILIACVLHVTVEQPARKYLTSRFGRTA